jgi:CheY-like chemotaxis protein
MQPDAGEAHGLAGECLRVAVADTGIGIMPADQERVFLEFVQLDSSYARQQQGAGLGLALCKKLVEMHGGRIWCESAGVEGQGSAFIFLIPTRVEPSPSATTPAPAPLRPLVIAMVDDPQKLRLVSGYLAKNGYEVASAPKIEDLAQLMKAKRPHAIVVDQAMACQERVQKISVKFPVAILSVSAHGEPGFRLLKQDQAESVPVKARLMDALRQTESGAGKEVKTVIIMEDDATCAELLGRVLLEKGFEVFLATDGRQGLDLVHTHPPDIIILDLAMPEMDGVQVVEQLRANPLTRNIPVMVHTGQVLSAEDHQHLAMHVQSITTKTEPQRLLANVEQTLKADHAPGIR